MKYILICLLILFFHNHSIAQDYAVKKRKDLYGVTHKKTKTDIIPYEYDYIEEIGLKESFFILSKNGKQGIVDSENQIIFPLDCDSIVPTVKDFPVNFRIYKGSKLGYFNFRGHFLPIEYDMIREVYKGKLIAKKDGKYGVLHNNGEIIYNCEYEEVLSFSEEYLCAKVDKKWVGIKDHKIIHTGDSVVFSNPDRMATCASCSSIEDPKQLEKCTQDFLNKILHENIVYPEKARINKKEGIVLLTYIVDEKGSVIEIKTVRDVNGYFEEECKRIIGLFPKFVPAMHEGKAVRCIMPQLFRFKLK